MMNITLWQVWLIAAFVLMIVEILSNLIVTACLACGCLCACLLALCGVGIPGQLFAAAVGSVLSAIFIVPLSRKFHKQKKSDLSNMDAIVGQQGVVTEAIPTGGKGRVKIDGDCWLTQSESNKAYSVGDTVCVKGYDSIVLIVE